MQNWYSTLFQLSPQIGDIFSLPRGPWIFRNHKKAPISISLSRLALFHPPPAVRRRWTSSTTRPRPNGPGEPSSATWPTPWHFPTRTRVPDTHPSRHATPAMRSAAARSARSPSSRPGPIRPPPDATHLTQELPGL